MRIVDRGVPVGSKGREGWYNIYRCPVLAGFKVAMGARGGDGNGPGGGLLEQRDGTLNVA